MTKPATIGHNAAGIEIDIELRLFNSVARKADGAARRRLTLPAGSTVGDILAAIGVRVEDVFLVLCNGRDVTRGLYGDVNTGYAPEDGDVIAVSGAVPYSWGYGAPVV